MNKAFSAAVVAGVASALKIQCDCSTKTSQSLAQVSVSCAATCLAQNKIKSESLGQLFKISAKHQAH